MLTLRTELYWLYRPIYTLCDCSIGMALNVVQLSVVDY